MIAQGIILYIIISILMIIALLITNGQMTPTKEDGVIISLMGILWPITVILFIYASAKQAIRKYRKKRMNNKIRTRYYEDLCTDAVIKVKGHILTIKTKNETLVINTKTSKVKFK